MPEDREPSPRSKQFLLRLIYVLATQGYGLKLEAPYIRLFSFYLPKDQDPLQYRDEVMRRMKALIRGLSAALPAERQAVLPHWDQRLQGSISRSFEDAEEKRDASVPDRQGLGIGPEGIRGS